MNPKYQSNKWTCNKKRKKIAKKVRDPNNNTTEELHEQEAWGIDEAETEPTGIDDDDSGTKTRQARPNHQLTTKQFQKQQSNAEAPIPKIHQSNT